MCCITVPPTDKNISDNSRDVAMMTYTFEYMYQNLEFGIQIPQIFYCQEAKNNDTLRIL